LIAGEILVRFVWKSCGHWTETIVQWLWPITKYFF